MLISSFGQQRERSAVHNNGASGAQRTGGVEHRPPARAPSDCDGGHYLGPHLRDGPEADVLGQVQRPRLVVISRGDRKKRVRCARSVSQEGEAHHVGADERREQAGHQPAGDGAAIQASDTGGSLRRWQAASGSQSRRALFALQRAGSVCIGLVSPVRAQKARTSWCENVRSQVKEVPALSREEGDAVEQDARAAACLSSGCSQGRRACPPEWPHECLRRHSRVRMCFGWELSRMTCQTKRCSPGALPSTLDGGGIMLRACPAVCAHHDAAPATHTAVRTARHNPRHRRCPAPAATTPGTGVLEQSFVEAVDAEMAAAASPATWLPQTPPPAPVTSPPTREGDWSQKHYAQVCQHPHWQHPGLPCCRAPTAVVLLRDSPEKVVGLPPGRIQGPGPAARAELPHSVPRHAPCVDRAAACAAASRVRCGSALSDC
jgi:hypothetical protein